MAESKKPQIYDEWNRPVLPVHDPGPDDRVKREFAEESDINRIMERYTMTGEIPQGITGTYGDFSEPLDFMEAQEILLKAQAQFNALPAKVRDRFNHDPAKFLEYLHEEGHTAELQELGLLHKEPKAPQAAPARPPTPDTVYVGSIEGQPDSGAPRPPLPKETPPVVTP